MSLYTRVGRGFQFLYSFFIIAMDFQKLISHLMIHIISVNKACKYDEKYSSVQNHDVILHIRFSGYNIVGFQNDYPYPKRLLQCISTR